MPMSLILPPSGFLTKILYAYLISLMHSTHMARNWREINASYLNPERYRSMLWRIFRVPCDVIEIIS
jgi:hypothetical protein